MERSKIRKHATSHAHAKKKGGAESGTAFEVNSILN
jgi:hypothetical protein